MRIAAVSVAVALASPPARAGDDDPFDKSTMAGQVLGEAVGTLGGFLGGGLVGLGLDALTRSPSQWLCQRFTCLGAVTGAAVGMGLGAQVAGDLQDGRGKLWGTAIGTGVGVGAAVGWLVLVDRAELDVPPVVEVVLFLALASSGPIVGYHLSADEEPSSAFMVSLGAGRF